MNLPNRSIELNLPQRCSSHISSLTDIEEAFNCGYKAVEFMLNGNSGKMVSMVRINSDPYEIEYQAKDLINIANEVKEVPSKYIIDNGSNISDEFIKYALPLILNEPNTKYENGMPKFAKLEKHYIKF